MFHQHPVAIESQDHFSLKLPGDPQISPDGRHVAYLRTYADVQTDSWLTELCVIDRSTDTRFELGEASQPRWMPDGASLTYVRASGSGFDIALWDCESAASQVLISLDEAPSSLSWSPAGDQLAFVMRVPPEESDPLVINKPAWQKLRTEQWCAPGIYSDKLIRRLEGEYGDMKQGYYHIFLLNRANGQLKQLSNGPYNHGGPVTALVKMSLAGRLSWAPDGHHIVMSMVRNSSSAGPFDPVANIAAAVFEFTVASGAVRQLSNFPGPACDATISPDGRWIAFVGFQNQRKSFHTNVLHIMPRDGGEARAIAHPERMEIHQVAQWLPDSSGLIVLQPHEGDGCLVKVSLDGQWTTLTRDVGGGAATGYVIYQRAYSMARDGQIAYLRGSTSHTDEVASLTADGKPGHILTQESAWLSQRAIAPIETIWSPTRKPGTRWQSWLVRPADRPADELLPLIVWLHGGPYLAWGPQFCILAQIWAARGYAVLMPNPRGSLGYGQACTEELHHDFPGVDDLQVLDVIDDIVARGGIDPKRIHLAGESAGGVMTSWLIGHSDRFATAAVIYGVMDWTSSALTVDRPDYYNFYTQPNPPWEPGMNEHNWRRSPLSVVNRVRTPTIVICGERDWRTPISQSEMYFTALKLCGVDAALVRYPDNNHSLEWHPSHWLDLIEHLDIWFKR
jgi:dipeptidyl aminopeptidase/acylaminoacyl peptidase